MVVYNEVPSDLELVEFTPACLDELATAGDIDIFPTWVSADDARRYIAETDTGYARLDGAIVTSNVPDTFRKGWAIQIAGWRAFRDDALPSVGFMNAKAVFQQNDRWHKQLEDWNTDFRKLGGVPSGPPPLPPGQGTTGPATEGALPKITTLVVAAGVVAAIVVFGPKLMKER